MRRLPYRLGVGVVLFSRGGQVWMGERRLEMMPDPAAARWQFPQGGIDPGETAAAAARRELFEETGARHVRLLARSREWLTYDLPAELIGRVLPGFSGQKQRWFAMRFEGEDSEFNLSAGGAVPEFGRWAWRDLKEAIDLVVPFKRGLYARLTEEFGRFAQSRSGAP